MTTHNSADFSIHNLPWGIFSLPGESPRVGVAYGDQILDMAAVAELDLFDFDTSVFYEDHLNPFIALGKQVTSRARTQVQSWLRDEQGPLSNHDHLFIPQSEATMHLPVRVGDYTDFYSSIEHATNVGKLFRDPDNALLPNWRHLPVGYHGRASSIIVSGQNFHRPKGQVMPPNATSPVFKASTRLDFELEMAFIIGKDSALGEPISTGEAPDYIFGMVLFNDWSARDIQKWEYVPLGPFLGKNFASSVSPWVVPLEALEPFRVPGPRQEPVVLEYLRCNGPQNYDIQLEVGLRPDGGEESVISRSNFKYMYWNMPQQLAHHTVNGCDVRVGDMLASGTISGPHPGSYGSLLEISEGGKKPLTLADGSTRTFLEDHDTLTLRGYAEKDGIRVGFGAVTATVLPAK
ncbi:fumarylacetoacetase [Neolewinella lacunae]|uniref:fumarylacetoacetase n=1 Tax=Neolewinella lacunae TaxID=1517758 RepID=A0A923PFR2_9BACT|nr:fumarylacetoacetase [Neolewinella lacunae]MBC6993308.1 fumarylacetoacetase [Neolewinella lacunae]MDN3636851.1 fumarylacetoacetase [Neolewinella lacunae]